MPERNLVVNNSVNRYAQILAVGMALVLVQTGCSKLRQSTLDRDFLSSKRPPTSWSDRTNESADQYIADANRTISRDDQKDQARILDVSKESMSTSEKAIKLTADPSARPKSADARSKWTNYDRYGQPSNPKLPHVDPIEPPTPSRARISKTPSVAKQTAPPKSITGQSLSPITLRSEKRVVNHASSNTLRGTEAWPHQNPAIAEQGSPSEQTAHQLVTSNVDSAETNYANGTSLANQMDDSSTRDPANVTPNSKTAIPACLNCDSPHCVNCPDSVDGKNDNASDMLAAENPIADALGQSKDSPIDVATSPMKQMENTSSPTTESSKVVELELQPPELVATIHTDVPTAPAEAENDSESADDSGTQQDDQWVETRAGNRNVAGQPTAPDACAECDKPKCEDGRPDNMVEQNLEQTSDDQFVQEAHPHDPNSFAPATSDSSFSTEVNQQVVATHSSFQRDRRSGFPVVTIESTPATTDGDFVPASHMADVPESNEFTVSGANSFQPPESATEAVVNDALMPPPSMENLETEFVPIENSSSGVVEGFTPWQTENELGLENAASAPSTDFVPETNDAESNSQPNIDLNSIPNSFPGNFAPADISAGVDQQLNEESGAVAETQSVQITVTPNIIIQEEEEEKTISIGVENVAQQDETEKSLPDSLQPPKPRPGDNEFVQPSALSLPAKSALKVLNGAFCTEITGFGQFKPFANTNFRAGQRMLIYCEVENYQSEQRSANYHTTLQGSFVIVDQQGRAVQEGEFASVEDVSSTERSEFYMYFPVRLEELPAGEYQFQLSVKDLLSDQKSSMKEMRFQVR